MSDPAAGAGSQGAVEFDTRGGAPVVEQALALCIRAADAFTDGTDCGEALDALEALLPALGPADIDALLSHPGYAAVRAPLVRACAETWFERECELASRALDDSSSLTVEGLFGDHIPRDAYADELALLQAIQPRNVLIIGSGACPMSAIVVKDAFPDAAVVGMDRSDRACELSSRLLAVCGRSDLSIVAGDAAGPIDTVGLDCIVVALTVGVDEAEKRSIIHALRRGADPDTVLVVRTAAGWGRVLYPGVDLPAISAGADVHRELPPHQRSVAVAVRMSELSD